ncbi:MAG: zf-HC2 domain-containing protein [Trebonia sp.]
MSHLGDVLSALVDGELSGAELDRANAHVAACAACRVEANALRRLKHELRALAEVSDFGDMTSRLLAMPGQAGQLVPANQAAPVSARHRERRGVQRRRVRAARQRALAGPYPGRLTSRRRGRYALWSTVSLVVVGIGTAAFGMGGNAGATGPQIRPQLEVYDLQHAITSGDVPFYDPADVSVRVPVVAATP